ncbi:MAG: Isoquinoline 1-oxidoreductase subunit [Xanthobacteraceae bacterium]|nr:Isoquinoline 1-oxidoreductase subunit [Xanthobacteraceae bacterium]
MNYNFRVQVLVAALVLPMSVLTAYAVSDGAPERLASVESFASIPDEATRSAAIFTEFGKVLTHPRCMNCHPTSDRPRQGDARRLHQPPVWRGADGYGLPAMRCPICHTKANFDPAGVPGNPIWHLAPLEMGWQDRTLGQICEQIKDPARNGGRSLEALIEHIREEPLVSWAWAPGYGRQPAPGTQHQAGDLIEAWVQTGAVCPK